MPVTDEHYSNGRYNSNHRADHDGPHAREFLKNKQKIYKTQTICGICGKEVDFSIPYPDPMSACIDHIVPLSKGGHPSDINNMQLAHMVCNRAKSDNLVTIKYEPIKEVTNRDLPQSKDWRS